MPHKEAANFSISRKLNSDLSGSAQRASNLKVRKLIFPLPKFSEKVFKSPLLFLVYIAPLPSLSCGQIQLLIYINRRANCRY